MTVPSRLSRDGSDADGRPAAPDDGVVAEVWRSGIVESVHRGHLVVLGPDGQELLAVGDPDADLWPRSSLKPLQALALLRAGLEVDDEGLALACASHDGSPEHLAVVRRILADAGLEEQALRNTPDLPYDPAAALAWQLAGGAASSLAQNCSGKHAAMLATCRAAGWDTATYLAPEHPLQRLVGQTVAQVTGVPVALTGVDGCGAPLLSTSLRGLATAFSRIARAAAGATAGDVTDLARVGRAMTAHPDLVAGPGRDATRLMAAVPGLVAKDGAEGVYAVGLPDGSAAALKVSDGASRPRAVVVATVVAGLLEAFGRGGPLARGTVDGHEALDAAVRAVRAVGHTPVLGHGEPVGEVVPGPWAAHVPGWAAPGMAALPPGRAVETGGTP